jgi:hypothetical protein
MKFYEINRLLGEAIEAIITKRIRAGLALNNKNFCYLISAMNQFGVLKYNSFVRKQLITSKSHY